MNLIRQTHAYRIKSCILLIAVFLLGQGFFSGCKSNQDTKSRLAEADRGLHLRLETDFSRSEYSLGETVIVRMYLRNTTDKNIVICLWPSKAEQVFTHYEDNKPVVYKDTVLFDKPVSKDKSFVTIKSGAEIHFASPEFGQEWQEEFPSQYFDKVGRWELKITGFYKYTGERFGLNAWQGKLSSNTLSINIAPKVGEGVNAESVPKTDVQRMEDVHQIARIIERYHQITGRYPFAENWDNVEEDMVATLIGVFISTKKLPKEYEYPSPGVTGAMFPYDYFLDYLRKKLGPELTLPEEKLDPYYWVPYQFHFDGEHYFISAHLTKPNKFTRPVGGGHKYHVGSIAVPSQKIRAFSEIDQSK